MIYGTAVWVNVAPPSKWEFHRAYSSTATFTVPESGWYKVYCIGKSGDGAPPDSSAYGRGGGGSGGLSIAQALFSRGETISISIASGVASALGATARPAENGSGRDGGVGGIASGGNVGNFNGFSGGKGSPYGVPSAVDYYGETGGNGGMAGGRGGASTTKDEPAGGGGGGGARLPGSDMCPYISDTYTSLYRAANGASRSSASGVHATPYPALQLTKDIMLYGGGGGGGGHGYYSSATGGNASTGTSAVVIIEKGVPQ